ncbi:MAG: glycine betaine/L-proline ABC transporter substrate-binding protein ProX [Desulfurivibrionaceae bacterium]|nr:glycine betaine/L-proline ABC transporter substrate-binding protein ProX [Desulfurivibrionaceae bacterium]
MPFVSRFFISIVALATLLGLSAAAGAAPDRQLPGKGVVIQPGQNYVDGENFQTILVIKALTALGYESKPVQFAQYPALHVAVANNDVTFIADHWNPLHKAFFDKAGGEERLYRRGAYIPGCGQGYLIDKKTAQQHQISNLGQLKDPEIAALFDVNGNGKADLAGCPPGWGCERVIEHHLTSFGLRETVTHNQGSYSAVIAETITRHEEGEPVLYYTWTPYWVSGLLVPGRDVVWLEVPFSSLPDARDVDTTLPNGKNYGFEVNNQNIVANGQFCRDHPDAAKLFAIMQVSTQDVSAQNLLMLERGEGSWEACERHAEAWIRANQKTFDGWLEAARAAASP